MALPQADALPERFGKYRVEHRIAVGGMAEVYAASTPPPVVRRVAVKRIRPVFAADPDFASMFVDEARVAACFDHPNIVRVLDFEPGDAQRGEAPYLVMEHLDGMDLRTLIWEAALRRQWLPVETAAAMVASAARGLHYAHTWTDPSGDALQVIHRDLSPQNVMLTRGGLVKVVDFGIARAAGRNTRTHAGIIKGKYAYMSPEQVRGEALDARTDLFALGILLFELLTFQNPFRRERDEATLIAVTDEHPPDPRTGRPELPDDLCAIVFRGLAKPREERFQSALELAEALDAFVARRRSPVGEGQLAAFLRTLEATPRPEGPDLQREADRALPQSHIEEYARENASTIIGVPAFVAPGEGPLAAVVSPEVKAPAADRTHVPSNPASPAADRTHLPSVQAADRTHVPSVQAADRTHVPSVQAADRTHLPSDPQALADEATHLSPRALRIPAEAARPPPDKMRIPAEPALPAPSPRRGEGLRRQVAVVVVLVLLGIAVGAGLGLYKKQQGARPAPTSLAP